MSYIALEDPRINWACEKLQEHEVFIEEVSTTGFDAIHKVIAAMQLRIDLLQEQVNELKKSKDKE